MHMEHVIDANDFLLQCLTSDSDGSEICMCVDINYGNPIPGLLGTRDSLNCTGVSTYTLCLCLHILPKMSGSYIS